MKESDNFQPLSRLEIQKQNSSADAIFFKGYMEFRNRTTKKMPFSLNKIWKGIIPFPTDGLKRMTTAMQCPLER